MEKQSEVFSEGQGGGLESRGRWLSGYEAERAKEKRRGGCICVVYLYIRHVHAHSFGCQT